MNNPKMLLLVLYMVMSCVTISLSIPLILGKIPPNAWYGFRVNRTMENPAIWYPANCYSGMHMCGMGAVLIVVAITLYLLPQVGFVAYALTCLAAVIATLAFSVIRSFAYLHRLGR